MNFNTWYSSLSAKNDISKLDKIYWNTKQIIGESGTDNLILTAKSDKSDVVTQTDIKKLNSIYWNQKQQYGSHLNASDDLFTDSDVYDDMSSTIYGWNTTVSDTTSKHKH